MKKEIVQLKKYITGKESENASSHFVYPFFQKIFKDDKFKRESEASGQTYLLKVALL